MKTIKTLTLVIALTAGLSAQVLAGSDVAEMASICKAGAEDHFASEQPKRIKFRGISGPRQSKQVKLQVYPESGESFSATCELDTKSGQIVAMTRQS